MKFYKALYTWCWHSIAALKQTAAAIATYINYDTGELYQNKTVVMVAT